MAVNEAWLADLFLLLNSNIRIELLAHIFFRMECLDFGKDLVPEAHFRIAKNHNESFQKKTEQMIRNKQLPEDGFNAAQIENIISSFSIADSNNFKSKIGAGEREGRVYSDLVIKRHFNLSHGIGRSGNITDPQPKAVGSSMIRLQCIYLYIMCNL